MSKTFNLYCDESTHLIHDGHPYMLLSYISIAYPQIRLAKEEIKAIKRKFNYTEELKWTNVHSATYKVYAELVDWFTCSGEKLEKMKKIMSYNSSIGTLQFIPSRESVFIQLADVLMGAINYNLRIQKGDVKGNVIAKLKLIEKIKRHSNISLNTTTPLSRNKFNLFFITLK